MKGTQPNRLRAPSGHIFAGQNLDLSQPIMFTLNGYEVTGFEGDTILSAALASGFSALARPNEPHMVLDEESAPSVRQTSPSGQSSPLPMERTLARNGYDYTVDAIAPSGKATKFLKRVMGIHATLRAPPRYPITTGYPWAAEPAKQVAADLVVVGAGLSGMAAALAAAGKGARVVLLEKRLSLGGRAGLFGHSSGEEADEALAANLIKSVFAEPAISVLTATEVLDLGEGSLLALHVDNSAETSAAEILRITTPRIVLATGTIERLPVFPGNRSPGCRLSGFAFQMARDYAVWPSGPAVIVAASYTGYRLAMLARDCDQEILRVVDSRVDPQSRFIDFTKAYGVPLASGLRPTHLRNAGSGGGLEMSFGLSWTHGTDAGSGISASTFILANALRPDLNLWHRAGGELGWDEYGNAIAQGTVSGLVLAGNADGWRTASACITSGASAIDGLFGKSGKSGKSAKPIKDPIIDPIYETPDDHPAYAPTDAAEQLPSWLDANRFARLQITAPARRADHPAATPGQHALRPKARNSALTLGELAALVLIGETPAATAGSIATERCILPRPLPARPEREHSAAPLNEPPEWLAHKFGKKPHICALVADDARTIELGSFIFRNEETDAIENAIGTIFAHADNRALVILRRGAVADNDQVSVATFAGRIWCRLLPWPDKA